MMTTAHPTPSPAAAHEGAPARRPLELLEARQQRDTLKSLLRTEQAAMADFLVALAAFDARRGWELLGHASLFVFLHVELRLSKGAAYVRFSAARLIQSHPEALAALRDGRLCLSSVGELGRVATPENFREVLPRFFGCSSREAREVAAAVAPRQAPPLRVQVTRVAQSTWPAPPHERPLPTASPAIELRLAPSPAAVAAAPTFAAPVDFESVRAHEPTGAAPSRTAPPTRDDVEPLTADLRRLHITVSRQLLKKLEAAQAGLGHAVPGATLEQVIDAAVDLLLEKQARARALVKRPRAVLSTVSSTSTPTPTATPTPTPTEPLAPRRTGPREAIPAAVRRAVWQRDGSRCSWPLDGGGCCGSTHRLELDHILPWARGGESTATNLRVVCHRHNAVAARQAFGARAVGRYGEGRAAGGG